MSVPIDRAIRQRALVPPERLKQTHALVIGVGAIGRQVALQLAAIGILRMTLYDDDAVAIENLAAQGYWPEDLGQAKVAVTARLCQRVYPDLSVSAMPQMFRRSTVRELADPSELAVFLCVDSIETRRLIWEALRSRVRLVIDGRMNAEVLRVIAVDQPAFDRYYSTTLFDASEAHVGACTARSTIYTASIAAGFMVAQFARQLRGIPVVADQMLNLNSAELTAA